MKRHNNKKGRLWTAFVSSTKELGFFLFRCHRSATGCVDSHDDGVTGSDRRNVLNAEILNLDGFVDIDIADVNDDIIRKIFDETTNFDFLDAIVRQLRDPLGMLHTLQLDAGTTRAAHVDVLAACAHARADQTRAAAEETDVFAGLAQLVGVLAVGIGDGFDQRHTEAVGLIDAAVADVADLAAGILFDAQLDEYLC